MDTIKIIDQIENIDLSKTNVKKMAETITAEFHAGNGDLLTAMARLEFLSQVIDAAKSDLRSLAVDELDLYGQESKSGVMKSGVQFKIIESGISYDYTANQIWNDLKDQENQVAEKRKSFETMARANKTAFTIIDDQGEILTCNPPIKSSKTTVQITLPK